MLYYGDPKKTEAFETLKRLGFFIPFSEQTLYHGRVANENGSEWTFSHSHDNSKNGNVANINGLYCAAEIRIADDYAKKRSKESGRPGKTEIHRIGCYDPDAVVVDREFDASKLNGKDLAAFDSALTELNKFSLFEASPVPFDKRHLALETREKLLDFYRNEARGFISAKALSSFVKKEQLDEQMAHHITATINTKLLLNTVPSSAVGFFEKGLDTAKQGDEDIPISRACIADWCDRNHVVGRRQLTDMTINKKAPVYFLFDQSRIDKLDKVATDKAEGQRKYAAFGKMFYDLQGNPDNETTKLMNMLSQSPKAIIQWASAVNGFENTFDQNSGVWEGYTIGEHTETTLRQFEDTFRYRIPKEIIPIINLGLVVHDIGKGDALNDGYKAPQDKYNVAAAKKFLTKLKIDPRLQEVICAMISDGKDLSFKAFQGNVSATAQARSHFGALLDKYDIPKKNGEINGIMGACRVMQSCDGAAYTDMGMTVTKTGVAYKNINTRFSESYHPPAGLTKRVAVLKGRQ